MDQAVDVDRIRTILLDCQAPPDEAANPDLATDAVVVEVWPTGFCLRLGRVQRYGPEMIGLLQAWPTQVAGQPIPALGQEIDYPTVSRALGVDDIRLVLQLFAFGKLLGWWKVFDPRRPPHHDDGDPLDLRLIRQGFVSIFGYDPSGGYA